MLLSSSSAKDTGLSTQELGFKSRWEHHDRSVIMNKINLVLLLLLGTFLIGINHASAATANASCSYNIAGSNHSYYPDCGRAGYNFTAGSSNNKVYCQNSPVTQLYSVNFMNNSYNNTLINCTFANARVYSLHGARNNLISPYGKYNLSFADNSSNVAIGYYFTFITRNISGARSYSAYVTIVPYGLYMADPNEIGSQGLTLAQIESVASAGNYILPRFGYYASLNSTNGTYMLPLESVQIFRNRTVSYNPYWMMSPFWGHDSVVFKTFSINSNMNYSPNLIWPQTREYVTLPDNATVYWNFSLIHYNNATNLTAYIFSGWQVDPNGRIMDVVHNVTGNTVSYNAGVQKPGIYEYIVALKSLQAGEHVNSTTETYSVGLSYCVTAGGVDPLRRRHRRQLQALPHRRRNRRQVHCFLRRALHGRERRRAGPRGPAGDPARPERRLLDGRYGGNLPGGSLLGGARSASAWRTRSFR